MKLLMENLPDRFKNFISRLPGIPEGGKFLLAVSGGIDSMVMMHLFYRAGYTCQVAHCNFQLRSHESDADETFVLDVAQSYGFPFHSKRFQTKKYALEQGISTQMAARELRYDWFDELSVVHHMNAIAVAQHSGDVAETMLLNLARGTGMAGMHGISLVRGIIIRPLLFASKEDLIVYAKEQNLSWRDDASNDETIYLRNKIRHQVLPVLQEINPGINSALMHHAHLMEGYELLLSDYFKQKELELVQEQFDGTVRIISLEKLLHSAAPGILLFHLLKACKPNNALCEEVLASSGSGAEFFSNGYRIVRDRDQLTIFSPDFSNDVEYSIRESDQSILMKFGTIELSRVTLPDRMNLAALPGFGEPEIAYLDASAINFPLMLRKWRKGDYFHPMGMKGSKLLSDYFIDEKFTSAKKEIVYLLVSGKEVVWIVGHRIDERFKIKDSTKNSIRFTYKPNL